MKRIGIYSLGTQQGAVANYIPKVLASIQPFLDTLIVVCSPELTDKARKQLEQWTSHVLVHNHSLSSISNYQRGFSYFKKHTEMQDCDELLFFDSSLLGAFFEVAEMFSQMEKTECDFWGITENYAPKQYLDASFLVYRKKLLLSREFEAFMKQTFDEVQMTQFFTEKGFLGQTYIHTLDLKAVTPHPSLYYAYELLANRRLPFLNVNVFSVSYGDLLDSTTGQSTFEVWEYLKQYFPDEADGLLQHLLKTQHLSELVKLLHLTYITPDWMPVEQKKQIDSTYQDKKIALLIHIFRTDMCPLLIHYAQNMPEQSDILITTDTKEKQSKIMTYFEQAFPNRHLEVRIIQNRGRDVSSKLVGIKDIALTYDLICCIHDKKTPHLSPQSIGESFGYKCFENVIGSSSHVYGILDLFQRNPQLGLLVPPEPNHAIFFTTLGKEWVNNFACTKKLAEQLQLQVPLDESHEPVAPFGSFFWFRPAALKVLYQQDWNYSDFPAEPIADDATILHAIERIYPFVAQHEGYYTARILSNSFARMEYDNLRYYTRGYNTTLMQSGMMGSFSSMKKTLQAALLHKAEKQEQLRSLAAQKENLEKEKKNLVDYVEYLEHSVIPKLSIKSRIKYLFSKRT